MPEGTLALSDKKTRSFKAFNFFFLFSYIIDLDFSKIKILGNEQNIMGNAHFIPYALVVIFLYLLFRFYQNLLENDIGKLMVFRHNIAEKVIEKLIEKLYLKQGADIRKVQLTDRFYLKKKTFQHDLFQYCKSDKDYLGVNRGNVLTGESGKQYKGRGNLFIGIPFHLRFIYTIKIYIISILKTSLWFDYFLIFSMALANTILYSQMLHSIK